ncbi:ABC transporter permease subunit [Armatimonas rosea]|uniref:ABC-type transport system involved in multi-copper enzyme maturation permease subunit n=1 Tax=Armatimonas rosea TaxID=685828 RepID=A0A7W9WA11_ARMRO|nr:ABC transporter permease subunit [Armatimonas rosea]MBB6053805.1 ABC-type transport system involved in multi-copper enzyme maturation permease subunit [Armatimonas rosea]
MSVFTENPVLYKEITTRFQLRRQSKANRIVIYCIVGLVIPLFYWFSLRAILYSQTGARDAFGMFLTVFETSLVVLLTPAMLASTITIEREKQTWNALLLSKLTHTEIVGGKFIGGLLPTLATLLVFFPLNIAAACVGTVTLAQFVLAHVLLLATTFFYGALGMFCSWACRRTQVATATAAGTVAFLVLGSPLALSLWQSVAGYNSYGRDATLSFMPLWSNPYYAMTELTMNQSNDIHPEVAVLLTLGSLVGAVLLLVAITRKLAHGPKEMSA